MSAERAKRVLVVDDDDGCLKLMGRLLRESGHEPILAARAVDGLRYAREARPALALLDVHLPEINGFDLIKLLQADASTRGVPVVFTSALPHKEVLKSAGSGLGARAFLKKPFDADEFEQCIRFVLEADEAVKVAERRTDSQEPEEHFIERGRLRMNPDTLRVWVNGQWAPHIRSKCLELLRVLMENPEGVSRDHLLEKVWNGSEDRQVVATTIQRLREDLKPYGEGLIIAVHGGYKLIG